MKTREELLDFYGVEIGKKYQITNTDLKISGINIFTVVETPVNYGGLALKFLGNSGFSSALTLLSECCYEEVKPSILDNKEREYLQKYVMDNPAFKGRVKKFTKFTNVEMEKDYLAIRLNDDTTFLPFFQKDTMYKNMEVEKQYTPKELGLEE